MTKTAIKRELHNIRYELDWLSRYEQTHNPDLTVKRHIRLKKTSLALKALQAND